jgi:hypothetical protein
LRSFVADQDRPWLLICLRGSRKRSPCVKAARGLDRFLLLGTEKTLGELNLMAITHNLLKLHRAALNPA